jgi:queuine tRNA-ribosyltransferase
LFKVGELLGLQIATLHNLAFYLDLVSVAREKILEGGFYEWKNTVVPQLGVRL